MRHSLGDAVERLEYLMTNICPRAAVIAPRKLVATDCETNRRWLALVAVVDCLD